MIVGITGTGLPFRRLVDALARHAQETGEAVWVQHGAAELPRTLQGEPWVPRERLLDQIRRADVVVTHGGCGALFDALSAGHLPVVLPRLKRYGEHINDHQLELVDALQGEGRILVCEEPWSSEPLLSIAVERSRARRHSRPQEAAGSAVLPRSVREAANGHVREFAGARRDLVLTLGGLLKPLAWRRKRWSWQGSVVRVDRVQSPDVAAEPTRPAEASATAASSGSTSREAATHPPGSDLPSSRMKVAFVYGSNSRSSGGLYNSVRGLGQELLRLGTEVAIVAYEDDHSVEDLDAYRPLYPIPYHVLGPRRFGYSPDLGVMLDGLSPDLVHINCLWMHLSWVNLNHHRASGTPYMISPRGMLDAWALQRSFYLKRIAHAAFEGGHLQGAACLHALNSAELAAIRAYGLRNPVAVIPNGVSLPDLQDATKPSQRRLLYLGRLHPKKGLPDLLSAWAKCSLRARGWHLEIAGASDDGLYEQVLQRLVVGLGVSDSTTILGPRFHRAKDKTLRAASALVLPSYSEGLPMTILEAWAYRLPVLMTHACNLPEGVARGSAISVPTGIDGLRDGLEQLAALGDDDLTAMGERGRSLVLERFSWQQATRDMEAVYRWVLGGGPPPTSVETFSTGGVR